MNKRKACLVGLAAGATLLAGCVAQYQNPSACEQEMRTRLGNASLGELSVTHTAVSYRGKRVVVEGTLARGALPASGVLSASAAAAVSGAPVVSTAGASGASVAPASTGAVAARDASVSSASPVASSAQHGAPVPASGVSAVSAASGASAASAASAPVAESKPTTPMAALAVKLGLHKAPPPSTAAECTYDKTGSLLSFRWLSPAALAKTTPAPGADDE